MLTAAALAALESPCRDTHPALACPGPPLFQARQ